MLQNTSDTTARHWKGRRERGSEGIRYDNVVCDYISGRGNCYMVVVCDRIKACKPPPCGLEGGKESGGRQEVIFNSQVV